MITVRETRLRDELAEVLDLLRQGNAVTLTQPGKPDLVLRAAAVSAIKQEHGETAGEKELMRDRITAKSVERLTFEQTKAKTQRKHAHIIHALADK